VILLRIIPTAVHTIEDVEYTIKCFKEMKTKLEAGKYKADNITSMVEAIK
jgi:glycine C-acetyltransferase